MAFPELVLTVREQWVEDRKGEGGLGESVQGLCKFMTVWQNTGCWT